ncbi:MAG: ankyrin repeat domain-containing protein [Melioribacteraceae bacterium]|nr:ankyrin repeat domain-containing protein [Melioribacteraceae bacterium]
MLLQFHTNVSKFSLQLSFIKKQKLSILMHNVFLLFVLTTLFTACGHMSLVHEYAESGNMEGVIAQINESKENVNLITSRPWTSAGEFWFTPLIYASENGHIDIVNYLLKNGADPNHKGESMGHPISALSLAIYKNHAEIVRALLKAGAEPNEVSYKYECEPYEFAMLCKSNGITPLTRAVLNKNYEIVKVLLEGGAEVNVRNPDGFTPIIAAAHLGDEEMVKLLIEYGGDVNGITNQFTALGEACLYGHKDVVELLVLKGADVNYCPKRGFSALTLASFGNSDLVKYLLEKGADSGILDKWELPAIVYALGAMNFESAELLSNSDDISGLKKANEINNIFAVKKYAKYLWYRIKPAYYEYLSEKYFILAEKLQSDKFYMLAGEYYENAADGYIDYIKCFKSDERYIVARNSQELMRVLAYYTTLSEEVHKKAKEEEEENQFTKDYSEQEKINEANKLSKLYKRKAQECLELANKLKANK